MTLHLYNTLLRAKEPFAPIDPKNVRMYVCGPTVYDLAHIGNARPVIVFDVLYRLLRLIYGEGHVTYVRNITDVDDKINAAAREKNVPIAEITEGTTAAYHADMAAVGALPPDHEPRATGTIPEMIAMIETLIRKGHAYAADGHVLFAVQSFADYGKLSRRDQDELIAGARVEVAPYKKYPGDFVLWKPSDAESPGWDSPWGRGRPGWHIECSAMSKKHLGATFDIHGGGRDLIFPHHENEVAQSVCANAAPFARYWVHNGFLTVEGEKMSKSLGNFRTVRQELEKAPGEAIRLAMLKTHYRQPLDWSDDSLKEAREAVGKWYRAYREVTAGAKYEGEAQAPRAFVDALCDDLNTPEARTLLDAYASEVFIAKKPLEKEAAFKNLLGAANLVGLLTQGPDEWFHSEKGDLDPAAINELVARRVAAKKAKDFAEADRIRDELQAAGVILEDRPGGVTEWRRA